MPKPTAPCCSTPSFDFTQDPQKQTGQCLFIFGTAPLLTFQHLLKPSFNYCSFLHYTHSLATVHFHEINAVRQSAEVYLCAGVFKHQRAV